MVWLLTYLLTAMGLTILIVWPSTGPSAWVRERLLRRVLPAKGKEVLDCYICLSFWSSLLLSPVWWVLSRQAWCWLGCLMTPAVFWLVLRPGAEPQSASTEPPGNE